MKLIFLLVFIVSVNSVPTDYEKKNAKAVCGYESCPAVDPEAVNVHLIPHSHDDVGWLKTVEQYYWGSNSNHHKAGVQYIINSVITALRKDPSRRFIQVESAFLYRWWNRESEEVRQQFLELVENGQLEIIGGAWSMNDEAATHYHSIIDQFTLGLRVVDDLLGSCGRPKIGWQIDPFGHSKEMASIFSQMGYDAMFAARLDYRDKEERMNTSTAEMIYQGSASLGDSSNIFLTATYNEYSAPKGYCFDVLCQDEPMNDNKNSPDYNIEEKVVGFADFIRKQTESYVTNNIMITMGEDFHYQDALSYFINMDRLIKGFEEYPQTVDGKPINIFYSTPSCYIKAVNDVANADEISFPLKTDDFFPYASDPHCYWTGYFTSRPTSKRFERQGNNVLQVAKQMSTFVDDDNAWADLFPLKDVMGIMQHHDAITGTERQHVADDYHRMLADAIAKSDVTVNRILSALLPNKPDDDINLGFQSCLLANVSVCSLTQGKDFIAAVYNPLSRSVSPYIRLPVEDESFTITGPDGNVAYQVIDSIDTFDNLPEEFNPAPKDLVFRAVDLPPLGLKLYRVAVDNTRSVSTTKITTPTGRITVGDDTNGFVVDDTTKRLTSITLNGITQSVSQTLMYYIGQVGDNSVIEKRASGAYIFRPDASQPENPVELVETPNITLHAGDLVTEVHQDFGEMGKQIIRLYKDTNYIEFDWLIGPINIDDDLPKEIISRFDTKLDTGEIFYTDSNGREMLERRRNYKETFPIDEIYEEIAGNYYPVTSRIALRDVERNEEFVVLNDRAQGGSSLKSGQVEIMLHRRLLNDDAKGVAEALNETEFGETGIRARGQLIITFAKLTPGNGEKSSAAIQRDLAQQKILAPWTYLTNNVNEWNNVQKSLSGLHHSLPENVQILTLEPWRNNTHLLRFEHVFAEGEDESLSKEATINLDNLFMHFEIDSMEEMNLAANQKLADENRLSWTVGGDLGGGNSNAKKESRQETKPIERAEALANIAISPMEIKTFIITAKYKDSSASFIGSSFGLLATLFVSLYLL